MTEKKEPTDSGGWPLYKYAHCHCGLLVRMERIQWRSGAYEGTCPNKDCEAEINLQIYAK